MRKGETKIYTDGQKLKHLARLVYAMRRAQNKRWQEKKKAREEINK